MIIASTSDIHGRPLHVRRHFKSPPIETLILAGDICGHDFKNFTLFYRGNVTDTHPWDYRKIDFAGEAVYQKAWAEKHLKEWVEALKPKHVIWVNGNHEFLDPAELSFVTHGLKTGSLNITVEGVKIGLLAGSMPFKGEWSDEVAEDEMKSRIALLDEDIEILVSHVPPYGILDRAHLHSSERIGCQAISDAILGGVNATPKFKRLKHHFFGHAHEESGDKEIDGIQFHNLSNRVSELNF